jgi:hypothetical protein
MGEGRSGTRRDCISRTARLHGNRRKCPCFQLVGRRSVQRHLLLLSHLGGVDPLDGDKQKIPIGAVLVAVGNRHEPRVLVEAPKEMDLEARTSDGGLKVYGIEGTVSLHTSDGGVEVADVSGAIRLVASDGSIRMHNLTGTLESRSSDGNVTIDGKLSGVQVHTSDGSLDLTLAEGSQLTTASRVEASDGNVKIRLPKTLAADIDMHTGDGHIDCQLPLTMNGYNSGGVHTISGKLNAGGTPLTIHTRDGNVTVGAL